MTPLQSRALARDPLPKAEVEAIARLHPGPAIPDESRLVSVIRLLCESHERLRMELEGAGVLVEEGDRKRTAELVETAQWLDERAAVLEEIARASRSALRDQLRLEVVRIRGRSHLLRLLASSDSPVVPGMGTTGTTTYLPDSGAVKKSFADPTKFPREAP